MEDARPGTSVLSVDTTCLVPVRLISRGYEKAYAFRSAASPLRKACFAPTI